MSAAGSELPPTVVDQGAAATADPKRLDSFLKTRPDPQDLVDRHILLDTSAAPSLQAAQAELDLQRRADALKKGLAKRPEKEALVERNILPASSAAPAILGHQRELERQMRADDLQKALLARPEKDELVKGGVLKENEA